MKQLHTPVILTKRGAALSVYLVLLIIFSQAITFSANAQIVINEISASNTSTIQNGLEEYDDWIEIYNSGGSAVNLAGYHLSDDNTNFSLFTFPAYILQPDSHLIVFASDDNRTTISDHWETPINASDIWKYYSSNPTPDTNWRNRSFNDAAWNTGAGGIGFGDGDDQTTISQCRTVLMRKTFNVSDTSQIVNAIFNIDYDDGFVAYLNGIEIARANIGVQGVRPAYNELAILSHEAKVYQGEDPDSFFIDHALFKSALVQGSNVLAVEVHNQPANSGDLTAIVYLSFGIQNPGTIYGPTPPFFNNPPKEYYNANFKLSRSGETVYLTNASSTIIDSRTFVSMQSDHSNARIPDGSVNWCFVNTPSPGSTNDNSVCYTSYALPPIFSLTAGFYTSSRWLTLTNPQAGLVRYTLNGDEPTATSTPYLFPILINSSQVVRAKAFSNGKLPSATVTNTYFIDEDITLPVFAINTDSLNLWDENTGIYSFGPNAQPNYPYFGANFWQDREKNASIEFFDRDKSRIFNFDASISIYGNYSRAQPQKSFEIKLSDRLGQGEIHYPLFSDKPEIDETDNFVLRNSGTDYNIVHFRDAFMERVMKPTHTGYVAAEPAVVFLNGDFWGVYTIHENHDHHWIKNNFGYEKDEIDYLKEFGSTVEVKEGTDDFFWNTLNYVTTQDSSRQQFYALMDSTWDLKNVIDYWTCETYFNNGDWIGDWTNNIKMWRPIRDGGKGRYLLYDLDFGLGYDANFTENRLSKAIHPTARSYSSQLFNGFLRNAKFKREFINRYADLINTIFLPNEMFPIMHQFQDSMAYDMPEHFAKWGSNMTQWQSNINVMRNFINLRADTARSQIRDEFGLAGKVLLTLNVTPANAGRIQISTVVPDSYPWSGVYFNGNPVTITAIPNPGYTFNHWSSPLVIGGNDPDQVATYNFTGNDAITAHFSGSAITPQLTISEFNYNSGTLYPAEDWLELHNYGNVALDISGWMLKDENDWNTFTFPVSTVIPPNGYLVIAEDLEQFRTVYPTVNNVIGPLGFNLSNAGEQIRFIKNDGTVFKSFYFQDVAPWPVASDGQGYTNELTANTADLSIGASWYAGCIGGSPGVEFSGALNTETEVNGSTTFCVGGSVALVIPYTPGYTYQWQRNNADIPGATDTLLTSSVAGTYNVIINFGGCTTTSLPTVVTVVTQGADPVIAPAARCGEGQVQLSAYAPDSIYWFAAPGGNIIGTGPNFITPYLTGTTQFFAQTSLTCPSNLVDITVEVNPVTAAPVCPDQNRCGPGNVILNAVDTAEVRWYNAQTGGALIHTGNLFITGFIPHDTVYYMEAGIVCPSERLPVIVTVTSAPAPTVTDNSRCGPGTVVLNANAADPIFWYDAYFGGTQVGSGFNFLTPALSTTTTYYAEAVGACASERIPAIATIHEIPAPPVTSDTTSCGQGVAYVNAVSVAQVYWYDAPVGGNLLGTGSLLTTPPLTSDATFYAASFNICESSRTPADVVIIPVPTVELGNDTAIETGTTLMLDAGTQTSYLWSTGETTQTITVNSAATYSVIVTGPNGCTSVDSIGVTLFIGINENAGGTIPVYAFPNPATEEINLNIISSTSENALIKVIDATGKEVMRSNLKLINGINQHTLYTSSIAKGLYYLYVLTDKNSRVMKIIIQ
ncbi:MAG: CotH kinase family protein [Bacteroidetes bacterium]|nr:CotH kinase family protein [Bacteroidota bacterium]